MTGSVQVRGIAPDGKEEMQNVWVDKRSAFGLEIVSLIESGIAVELKPILMPEDQCIRISDMHGTFYWLVAPTPTPP